MAACIVTVDDARNRRTLSTVQLLMPGPIATSDDEICKPFATYPGSKDAGGVCEWIIDKLPAHSVYVEPFIGGGAVLRRKAPALCSIAIDSDARAVKAWRRFNMPGVEVVHGCGLEWLRHNLRSLPDDALVYCDPPYPMSTRSGRKLYREEWSEAKHEALLEVLDTAACSVAVSTYPNPIYTWLCKRWSRYETQAMTRGGVMRTEVLYVKPAAVAITRDHRFAGINFRDRERIKRKAARWVGKFTKMSDAERNAVLVALLGSHQKQQRSAIVAERSTVKHRRRRQRA
jgi:hypothetical protein